VAGLIASTIAIIASGALLGGFISGLAGFGTGLVALGIWLMAVPPAQAATLVIFCSVVAQVQTIPSIWHAVDIRRIWPIVTAGLIGVPLGVWMLDYVDPDQFRLGTGAVLVTFSSVMLIGRARFNIVWGGQNANAFAGLCGGILGGLSGLSGPLPTMWITLRGWGKDHRRGVMQAYNLAVLALALVIHTVTGLITREMFVLLLFAMPGTLAGAWLGSRTYRRLTDTQFHNVVLGLLALSGCLLISPVFLR
jgi:uncharacterized membrane protein YfcA